MLIMAIIRKMICVVFIVVPGLVSTWWLCCGVCRVGRDLDSSCSLVCMSVCNPVEGIQCRIKSLGLFKGTVPLLRHILSRINSLGLFKGIVPLLRFYCRILSFCDSTVPNPWCLSLPTTISFPPPVRGRLLLVVAMIGWVILIVFVLLASCWFEC